MHRIRTHLVQDRDRNVLKPIRVSLVYLLVSSVSHVVANSIGSLSEYRQALTQTPSGIPIAQADLCFGA